MKLSLVHALAWIIGSLLFIPGAVYKGVSTFGGSHHKIDYLCRIIQTGPQKEALRTPYLAEVIELSADKPVIVQQFDPMLAQKKLRLSPVIKSAFVKMIKPDAVYIDYTVRQPIAWLYDFENIALDDEGVPFPIIPFFSPKKLPEIVLGLTTKPIIWGHPLKDEKTSLALTLLKMMQEKSLNVLRVDIASSFAPSLGQREVVVILEESGYSKFLRLTPKNFAQELGNYLELRKTLPPETQIIDLRIPQLAFIDGSKTKRKDGA